jgi:hypothetical protein
MLNGLQKIIKDLKDIMENEKMQVSDEALCDLAVRIFNSNNIHMQGRTKYFKQVNEDEPKFQAQVSPATPNQIWVLKNRLGYKEDTSQLTREEASDLIDELKGKIQ